MEQSSASVAFLALGRAVGAGLPSSLPGQVQNSVCKDADECLNGKDQLGSASLGVCSGGITHLALVIHMVVSP